jgi:hypothetical protein
MLEGDRSLTPFGHFPGHCAQPQRIVRQSELAPLAHGPLYSREGSITGGRA